MARQDIKVRITGENKTGAAFRKFRGDVDSTKNAIASLRNQIIAAFGVREIIRAGDTFVNVQNRMMALSGSAEKTADAMAHMKRIANESRSDFDAIGTLFTRLTIATQELGVSQNDIAKATQTVANTNPPRVMSLKYFPVCLILLGICTIFAGKHFHAQEELVYANCMAKNSNYNYCKVLVWGR